MLQPLQRTLRKLGIYLLKLPSSALRPGAILNAQHEAVQQLTDLRWLGESFFAPVGRVRLSAPLDVDTVVNTFVQRVDLNMQVGVGVPNVATIRAGLETATFVEISVGPLKELKLQVGKDELGLPAYLEGMDFTELFNEQHDFGPLQHVRDRMKKRRLYLPTPREFEIVESLIYAESLSFSFYGEVGVGVGLEPSINLAAAHAIDMKAGLDVSVAKEGTVTWKNGTRIPLGYRPVRYAWRPIKKRFGLATY